MNCGTARFFRRSQSDCRSAVIGKTGVGKSHLLRIMIEQDIQAGQGCALFDPHGDLARELQVVVPPHRVPDLVYFDAGAPNLPWRFNPFRSIEPSLRALAAAQTIDVFKKLWPDEWGPRLEHLLRNVVLTLLETHGGSLADIPPLLTDREARSRLVSRLTDPVVTAFWKTEYERYSPASELSSSLRFRTRSEPF